MWLTKYVRETDQITEALLLLADKKFVNFV